jgi:hypothetical protein
MVAAGCPGQAAESAAAAGRSADAPNRAIAHMQQKDIAAAIGRNPSVVSREDNPARRAAGIPPLPSQRTPRCISRTCIPVRAGTNENTNGIVREYFPKGTEITVGIHYLQAVADEINDRPSAMLGFRTPAEVFAFAELLVADNPEDNLSPIASTG